MRKAKGSGFKMRSGNKTSFKKMGSSSPVKNINMNSLMNSLQMTPTPNLTPETPAPLDPLSDNLTINQRIFGLTAAQKAERRAAQKAAREAEIAAAQAANPGGFDFSNIPANYVPVGTGTVSGMYSEAGSQQSADAYQWYLDNYGNTPNNQIGDDDSIAASSSDLQKELTDKLQEEEAEEYNPDAYQGSLYDYSVRKKTPMSKKRSAKGKRGYKMKRK